LIFSIKTLLLIKIIININNSLKKNKSLSSKLKICNKGSLAYEKKNDTIAYIINKLITISKNNLILSFKSLLKIFSSNLGTIILTNIPIAEKNNTIKMNDKDVLIL
jgi:hypothetical protein